MIGTSGLFSSSKFSGYSIFDWLFKTRAKVPSQSTQTFSSETQPIQVTPQALSGNCDDNNPCTKDDCISTTQPTSQPVPSLTIVATQSATSQPCTCVYTNLADGTPCSTQTIQDGFCKKGTCVTKTCDSIFGAGKWIACPDAYHCCNANLQQCCGRTTCCNKQETPPDAPAEYLNQKCSALGAPICIDLKESCEKDGKHILCTSTYKDLCCPKTHTDGTPVECGVANKVPFCGYKRNEEDKCPDGRDPCKVESNTFSKDVIECCASDESCILIKDKKGCSKNKDACQQGIYCSGQGDYVNLGICCQAGEVCLPDGDGWPRCKGITA